LTSWEHSPLSTCQAYQEHGRHSISLTSWEWGVLLCSRGPCWIFIWLG
jgi:hypothetical protein